jgi:hypothetical protein
LILKQFTLTAIGVIIVLEGGKENDSGEGETMRGRGRVCVCEGEGEGEGGDK